MSTPEPTQQSGAIQVFELNYQYPCGVLALKQISFQIQSGERVGLVGPSGAGKSTLLQHLNGLFPEPGFKNESDAAVTIQGIPVSVSNLFQVRQQIGLLFQNPDDQLFCPTVAEDVAFGPEQLKFPPEEIETRVIESLQAVDLLSLKNRPTTQLSYGQKKRACLAGLLACTPQILALDEPFSGLDPQSRKGLISILKQLESTMLIATHDLDIVLQLCSRVLVLNEGSIQADGPANEILSDEQLMERNGLEVPLRIQLEQL